MNKDEEYEYSVPVAHHLNTGTAKVTLFSFFLKDGTKTDIIFFVTLKALICERLALQIRFTHH